MKNSFRSIRSLFPFLCLLLAMACPLRVEAQDPKPTRTTYTDYKKAAPGSNPASGYQRIYIASDGIVHTLSSAGVDTTLGGAVSSVFGRTGAVTATSGDYSKSLITGLTDSDTPLFAGLKLALSGSLGTNTKLQVGDPNTADNNANVMIRQLATGQKGLVVQRFSSGSSANPFEVQTELAGTMASIDVNGGIHSHFVGGNRGAIYAGAEIGPDFENVTGWATSSVTAMRVVWGSTGHFIIGPGGSPGRAALINNSIQLSDYASNTLTAPVTNTLVEIAVKSGSSNTTALKLTNGSLVQESKDITLAAAASSFSAASANIFYITGDGGGNTITSITDGVKNQTIRLYFVDGNVTISDAGSLKLNGAFTSSADDSLVLTFNGTNWIEDSRSAN